MEKIQKALEKAKLQREQQEQKSGVIPHEKVSTSVRHEKKIPEEINYSQTQCFSATNEVLKANRVVAGIEGDPNADLFRVLRTKLLQRMRKDGLNTLAVTSPQKGGGKSMITANLAIAIAMEMNQTVMLVDLDLRRPSVHKYFGFEPEKGLVDYLLDGADLPGLLVNPGIERLVILPAGRQVTQSSELISTPRMLNLVEEITNRYTSRIILFDLPPLLGMDDALTFLPNVQSTVLVVEEGGNSKEEIQQSIRLLENANLLGTVYNKAREINHSPY